MCSCVRIRRVCTERGSDYAQAVRLNPLLFVRDMAEKKMEKGCGGGSLDAIVEVTQPDCGAEPGERLTVAETKRLRTQNDLGTVSERQQSISQRPSFEAHGRGPIDLVARTRVRAAHDSVRHGRKQSLLVLEVPIQRARLHVECQRQSPHREISKTVLIENGQRGLDDIESGMPL